jgi:hypothetical protein
MSRFAFLRKSGRLKDPIAATALVVRGDPGYSATTWWTAALRLRIAAPGHSPVVVEHETRAVREKTPFTGLTLPVFVERDDPAQVQIPWDDVPTLERRIAERYPSILAPRSAWRDVIDADPSQADQKPDWGDGQVADWPFGAALRRGRRAGTAIVIGHSWDPQPHRSGNDFRPPRPSPYRYGGKIRMNNQEYLGWLLLCVIPPEGDRYAVHLRTMIKRDRLAPVLPVAIRKSKPMEVEIAWEDAPEVGAGVVEELPEVEEAAVVKEAPEVEEAPEVKEAEVKEAIQDQGPGDEQLELLVEAKAEAEKPKPKPRPRRAPRKPAASRNGKPAEVAPAASAEAPEPEPVAAPTAEAEKPKPKPKPRRTTKKPPASRNGKPAANSNGKPANKQPKAPTRARAGRTGAPRNKT